MVPAGDFRSRETMLDAPLLRIVVVLYRLRLRELRPLLGELGEARLGVSVVVSVVVNRDDYGNQRRRYRRVSLSAGIYMEVHWQDNVHGVTGAYNLVIESAQPADVLVILDGDSRLRHDYFREVWSQYRLLRDTLMFISPELLSGNVRVSPYRLAGIVPLVLKQPLDPARVLRFADGFGVINACLAGTVSSFRKVAGFSDHICLDLSDVAWSIQAGRKRALLAILPAQQHRLSMLSTGFGLSRLRRYLVACWRLARRERDFRGFFRLCFRGVVALPRYVIAR